MPCNDVTEIIEVVLDAEDRLREYWLSKRTCGQGVGHRSLLLDWLRDREAEELLNYDAKAFLADYSIRTPLEEFLALKHLFAIQSAIEVLTGRQAGGPDDPCAAARIGVSDAGLTIRALIRVDIITERIRACGNCKHCGKFAAIRRPSLASA